jgi:hypothetical protein
MATNLAELYHQRHPIVGDESTCEGNPEIFSAGMVGKNL